jgi:uncharacterized delta-60 repeat protein
MNKLTTFLLLFLISSIAYSQPGTIDNSFNVGVGADSIVESSAIQSDGKIIIGGFFNSYDGQSVNNLARLNADGTLDQSFSTGLGPDDAVFCIAIQSDGKIIIGGEFSTYNGVASNNIARLNSDGTLDQNFNSGAYPTGPGDEVHAITIQNDGKLLIGGLFSNYDNTPSKGIARVDADGTLDPSFDPGNGIEHSNYARIFEIKVQNDGKILIGGEFDSYNGNNRRGIARLNSDGSLDQTFDPGGGVYASSTNYFVRGIELRQDGKILIAGSFIYYNGELASNITLLDTDGTSADLNNDIKTFGKVYSLATQDDYKVIIGGAMSSVNGNSAPSFVARLNEDLTLDESFESVVNFYVYTINIQNDGKIIVGGQPWNTPFTETRVHRLNGGESNSLNEELIENQIKVYPNPAKSKINIKLAPSLINSKYEISLYDMSGNRVKGITSNLGDENIVKVNLNTLNSGLYLLEIEQENSEKIVKKISIVN